MSSGHSATTRCWKPPPLPWHVNKILGSAFCGLTCAQAQRPPPHPPRHPPPHNYAHKHNTFFNNLSGIGCLVRAYGSYSCSTFSEIECLVRTHRHAAGKNSTCPPLMLTFMSTCSQEAMCPFETANSPACYSLAWEATPARRSYAPSAQPPVSSFPNKAPNLPPVCNK